MKTLHTAKKIDNNGGIITEFVTFNGKKFKVTAQLRNGGSTLKADIMDRDGVFQFVLGLSDVNFTYTQSYVSSIPQKQADLELGLSKMKSLIVKIYE